MNISKKKVRLLNKLVQKGYDTDKKIIDMTLGDFLELPPNNLAELTELEELRKAIAAHKLLQYLVESPESEEVQ